MVTFKAFAERQAERPAARSSLKLGMRLSVNDPIRPQEQ
jgi:hypothetical protein